MARTPSLRGLFAAALAVLLLGSGAPAFAAPSGELAPSTRLIAASAVPEKSERARSEYWYSEAMNVSTCPRKAKKKTLRERAKSIGLYEICASSVAQSASAHAAYAVKFALRNLGTKYVQEEQEAFQRDDPNRFDCSSYVSRAYAAGDVRTWLKDPSAPRNWRYPVTVEIRDSVDWTQQVDRSDALPGDLVVYYTGAGYYGHHVVMLLSNDLMAHVNNYGEITHVTDFDHDALENPVYLRVVDNR